MDPLIVRDTSLNRTATVQGPSPCPLRRRSRCRGDGVGGHDDLTVHRDSATDVARTASSTWLVSEATAVSSVTVIPVPAGSSLRWNRERAAEVAEGRRRRRHDGSAACCAGATCLVGVVRPTWQRWSPDVERARCRREAIRGGRGRRPPGGLCGAGRLSTRLCFARGSAAGAPERAVRRAQVSANCSTLNTPPRQSENG